MIYVCSSGFRIVRFHLRGKNGTGCAAVFREGQVIYGAWIRRNSATTEPQRRAVRGALGFSDADYVIGMSALLRPEKNHLQMLEAISMLRKQGIPARALMIGDGKMREAIEARARELNVESDVVITGLQQEVRPYVAACDAMACAALPGILCGDRGRGLVQAVVHSDVGGAADDHPGRLAFFRWATRGPRRQAGDSGGQNRFRRMKRGARRSKPASRKGDGGPLQTHALDLCQSRPA
jgi:hypothetical protein